MAIGNKKLENYKSVVKYNQGLTSNYPAYFSKGVATTSGGTLTSGVQIGAGGAGVFTGTGTPTFTAPAGSLFLNIAGSGTANRLFVTSGSGTWIAVTTAS